MLRQLGRLSPSFGRCVEETALLQTPFNVFMQRCALHKQDTRLVVPNQFNNKHRPGSNT
ncbi:BQ5605_C033g11209 [Microbotryum silenes-dioicae]|uniref:BQ5605_C033g11209 protein n=1 Tax=Microbotryum silenes-dioicae TaxID=796604 RepID=A0A2X0N341_9BASI|nr:BQ5605_C033g11209 [Microbotryum silenes-dioicae]